MQPPKCVLNATLYKIKADYLRYIYECLQGEDGLLADNSEKELFIKEMKKKNANEIS